MPKLSVLILAKNEERNIEDCINSVKFADEVLVIDDAARIIQRKSPNLSGHVSCSAV